MTPTRADETESGQKSERDAAGRRLAVLAAAAAGQEARSCLGGGKEGSARAHSPSKLIIGFAQPA